MAASAHAPESARSRRVCALVFLIFFVIALLTNVLAPLLPELIRSFQLSLAMAGVLPFAFFIAYGIMSIPSGFLIDRFSEKPVLVSAFVLSLVAALAFALHPAYGMALVSLFAIGAGMAALQVAINPLLRISGGEEHFAFNSAVAQLIFASASAASPQMYSYLVRNTGKPGIFTSLAPPALPWVALYWIFAAVSAAMVITILAVRLPRVPLSEAEKPGPASIYGKLLRNPVVLLYFASAFAYVGIEQGTSNWMSQFLATYHGFDPRTTGANTVSEFWGGIAVGCLLGLALLKMFDERRVLIGASAAALAMLTAALFGPPSVSVIAFPLIGLCISVMWPIVIALALNSVTEAHGTLSGIMCTGIAGGALVPLIVGQIGDWLGLRAGMLFLYIPYCWVMGVGFWAKPIVHNRTIGASGSGVPFCD